MEDYGKELREGSPDSPATEVFSCSEDGEKRWKDLKNRVVEHVSPTGKRSQHVEMTVQLKYRRFEVLNAYIEGFPSFLQNSLNMPILILMRSQFLL